MALILSPFRNSDWVLASFRGTETDVGFSAGMLAVLSVASAAVRPPWRLRLRLMIWTYVLVSFVFIGRMADVGHFAAVALSMPFAAKLAAARGLRARALPSRHEIRLLAIILVLVRAATQLFDVLILDRLTPFGDARLDSFSGGLLVVDVTVSLMVANDLRHGCRLVWWIEILSLGVSLAFNFIVVAAAIAYQVPVALLSEFAPSAILTLACRSPRTI